MRTALFTVVITVLAVAGSSCGGNGTSAAVASVDWGRLPMMGFSTRVTEEQAKQIVATSQAGAHQRITACMTGHDLTYVAQRQPAAERTVLFSLLSRAPTVAAARQRGLYLAAAFRQPLDPSTGSQPDPTFATYLAALSATQKQRYDDQLNDCTKLGIGPLTDSAGSAGAHLVQSYLDDVLADPALGTAHRQWNSCMADRGHHVTGVPDLQNELRPKVAAVVASIDPTKPDGRPRPATVRDLWNAERAAAIDQATCDLSSYGPVIGHWATLERRWQAAHRAQIRALDPQVKLAWPGMIGL